jgi:hypothetical protein
LPQHYLLILLSHSRPRQEQWCFSTIQLGRFRPESVSFVSSLWGLPLLFNFGNYPILAILAISVRFCFSDHGDVGDVARFTGAPGKPGFGFLGWDSGDRRASRAPHPAFFPTLIENKGRTANRPKGDPCVTLG